MRELALVVAGGVLAAAITLAGVLAFGPALVPPPVPPEAPARASEGRSADSSASARIEERLERLAAAVTALERKVDSLGESASRTPVGAPADAAAPVSEDALVRAYERASLQQERARLAELSNDGMLAEARGLVHVKRDTVGARRMLEALLERTLSPEERAAAMTELGIVHRAANDLKASEAALQRVIDTAGIDTDAGSWAAFQLAWTVQYMKDDGRALILFDSVARSAVVRDGLRLEARWNAAKLAQAAGDTARARADFVAIQRECGTNADYRHILTDVQARLKDM